MINMPKPYARSQRAAVPDGLKTIFDLLRVVHKETGAYDTCMSDPDHECVSHSLVGKIVVPDEMTFGHVRRATEQFENILARAGIDGRALYLGPVVDTKCLCNQCEGMRHGTR